MYITFIIVGLIFIGSITYAIWDRDAMDVGLGVLLVIFVFTLGLAISCVTGELIGENVVSYEHINTPIVCIKDNAYFAISKSGDYTYYVYLTETEDGYISKQVKTKDAYVIMDSDKPYAEEINCIGFDNEHQHYKWFAIPKVSPIDVILHIPKGE